MDSRLYKLVTLLHHFVYNTFQKIRDSLNLVKAIFRQFTLANVPSHFLSEALDLENNAPVSADSIQDAGVANRFSVADPVIADPENVVGWTLSTGQYDIDKPILIDASNPSRFVTKRRAIEIVTSVAGAFEPDSTICLHLPNDVLYPVLVLGVLASKCSWTGTNTAYTSFELEHHFRISATRYVIALPEHENIVEAATNNLDWEIEIILFTDILSGISSSGVLHNIPTRPSEALHLYTSSSGNRTARRTLHDLVGGINRTNPGSTIQSIRPDQIAALQSTSGTTGLPKSAARTHRSLILESKAIEDNNAEKPYEVRRLFCTPIFHAFSTPEMLITPLRLGIPTYIMRRYDDTLARKIHDFGITEIAAPPPMLKLLQEQGQHHLLQGLRMIFCGGAPLMPELRIRVLAVFEVPPRIVQVWGMTEGGWFTTFKYPEDDSSGSVGRILPGLQIRMGLEHSFETPDGRKAGEMLVRGPQLMTGYLENERASKDAFVDGWLKTGDVGYIEDGKVYIVDRCKDLIKVNGWHVAPAEIEAAVLQLPGIHDGVALSAGQGVEEHPLLFIARSHGSNVSKEVVLNHLRSRMAKHKVASIVLEFTESIPRNPSGKILRRILRERAIEGGLMEM